jgi:uncharacterized membrane protein
MDWYVLALISMGLYATQGLLLKFAAFKKCDSTLTTFFYLLTVTAISVPLIMLYGITQVTQIGLVVATVNGIFYVVNRVSRIEALKFIQASILYPIVRLNNAVLVVIFILFLGETITLKNSIGIIIAVIALFLLSKSGKKTKVGNLEERL